MSDQYLFGTFGSLAFLRGKIEIQPTWVWGMPASTPHPTQNLPNPHQNHKLTVLTTVIPSTSVALKAEVLDTLKDDVTSALKDELPPRPTQTREFELCRALKGTRGQPKSEYKLLEDGKVSLQDAGVANWEALFLRFRDAEMGEWLGLPYFFKSSFHLV
ncbi:hypothetical protein B0H14DRAFT_3452301 [Mycena olivaceomarginata]|nr:hypothetical protein B0H14DRAFT_3452301 [Mycena olivaceomarginata]